MKEVDPCMFARIKHDFLLYVCQEEFLCSCLERIVNVHCICTDSGMPYHIQPNDLKCLFLGWKLNVTICIKYSLCSENIDTVNILIDRFYVKINHDQVDDVLNNRLNFVCLRLLALLCTVSCVICGFEEKSWASECTVIQFAVNEYDLFLDQQHDRVF